MYLGVKLHFSNPKYDYFKFNGKVKSNQQSFEKRNDRYFFKKLATKFREKELLEFYVSNFLKGDYWIGALVRDNGEKNYQEWKRIIDSITYTFSNDIDYLLEQVDNFDDLFLCRNNQHPEILKKYLSKKITLETLTIINNRLNFTSHFDKRINETLVWPEVKSKIQKYQPFLDVDYKKLHGILKTKVVGLTAQTP